jgi:hypothetical protein
MAEFTIKLEPTCERSKSLRDLYGDSKDEWEQIQMEMTRLQFDKIKGENKDEK